jgi:primosomal protein N' (replication factor Y)
VIVTGPAPAPIARLRGRYRFRAMVRSQDRGALRRALLHAARLQKELSHKVRTAIDVDPVQLL